MCLLLLFLTSECFAEKRAKDFLKQSDAWFASSECLTIAENILSYQSSEGGWLKNTDTVSNAFQGDRKNLHPTFDNGATTDELRFLARTYEATRNEKVRKAFDKGLAYILVAQYPNGGLPQTFPLSNGYNRHITFNDNSMFRTGHGQTTCLKKITQLGAHELSKQLGSFDQIVG